MQRDSSATIDLPPDHHHILDVAMRRWEGYTPAKKATLASATTASIGAWWCGRNERLTVQRNRPMQQKLFTRQHASMCSYSLRCV